MANITANILCPFAEDHVKKLREDRSPDDIPEQGDRIVILTNINNVWRGVFRDSDKLRSLYGCGYHVDSKEGSYPDQIMWSHVQRWAYDPFANHEGTDNASR